MSLILNDVYQIRIKYSPIFTDIMMQLQTLDMEGVKGRLGSGLGCRDVFRDAQHLKFFVLVLIGMCLVFLCVCSCWQGDILSPSSPLPLRIHLHVNPCSCSLIGSLFSLLENVM